MPKSKKQQDSEQQAGELLADLQRARADFENFRKRSDLEKTTARQDGQASAVLKLLPVIDNIERAITYVPDNLRDDSWAQSVTGLVKNLEKALESLDLKRIQADPGTQFDPELHEAIQFDDAAEGATEVIATELQAGYTLGDRVIRHAMVKVTRK